MKTFRATIKITCALTLLGAANLASGQVNLPNPQSPGMSPQNAVRIDATSDVMVDRSIQRWLRKHYPGWDADPHEMTEIGRDRYAVVRITTNNQPSRKLYFRIARHFNDDSGFPEFPQF